MVQNLVGVISHVRLMCHEHDSLMQRTTAYLKSIRLQWFVARLLLEAYEARDGRVARARVSRTLIDRWVAR